MVVSVAGDLQRNGSCQQSPWTLFRILGGSTADILLKDGQLLWLAHASPSTPAPKVGHAADWFGAALGIERVTSEYTRSGVNQNSNIP